MILGDLTPSQVEVERQKWAFMNEARAKRGLDPLPMPTDLELSEGNLRYVSREGGGRGFIKTSVSELEAKGMAGIRAADKRKKYLMYGGGAAVVVLLGVLFLKKKKRKK